MLHGSTWTAACKLVLRDQSYKHATWRPKHLQASERFYCAKPWYFFLLLLFFCLHLRESCLTWQNSLAPASAASLWSRRGLIQEINPAAAFLRIQQAAPPLSPILTFWELIFFQNVNSQNINSQNVNFPKCQLLKCQLPKCQLWKI